ncbi:TlpA family protein disulfide reductase [Flavobacteriaceae bacterium F08102]|nr:TlpA family protein disulfide reductase [Flavobacteriaceae bacterium F08102]
MKKIIYLSIVALTIISCKKETKVDYTILSGKIINKELKSLVLRNMSNQNTIDTVNLTTNGNFLDTLNTKPGKYVLFDGENSTKLYLDTGYHIHITYDVNDYENSLELSGVGADASRYQLAKEKKLTELFGQPSTVYTLYEDAYKAKMAEIKTANLNLLNEYESIDTLFLKKEKRNLAYEYLVSLTKYQNYHAYYTQKDDFRVSKGFLSELDNLSVENADDYMFSSAYKNLVSSITMKLADKYATNDSIDYGLAIIKSISNIKNEDVKNSLLFSKVKSNIAFTDDLEAFYTAFNATSTNNMHKAKIKEHYDILKLVSKGQPSPKFSGYENYNGETTSLDDLKGKYVYIDVWATWCAPCKAEIPFLKKVEKTYHDKNIEFVSISVDAEKDYHKWKTMVKKEKLSGIQLIADKSWKSKFVESYLIKGIPRFILIDPQGNIVSSNAPRPSDPKLIDLFNELGI